jgi:triacylglycerol lipase
VSTPFDNFDPNTTRWNPQNAWALAESSRIAYESNLPAPAPGQTTQDVMKAALANSGFNAPNFQLITQQDSQCFVAGDDQKVVVSFRGSANFGNWISDFEAIPKIFLVGMFVHKGFDDALDLVWDDVKAAIGTFRDKGQSLWFTGHSLGAAMACLAVARWILIDRATANGLYTFGQPRTGSVSFEQTFDGQFGTKTFRFVNDSDIVTRVPPREMGYKHVGQVMFFDDKGILQNDDHWWNKFLETVQVDIDSLGAPADIIKNHAIELYVKRMQANLARGAQLTWT